MLTSKTTEVEDRVLMLHFYIALCCTLSLCVCAQEFNITPLDPAVCAGADVTFRCSSAADKMSQLKQIQPIILREVEGDTDLKLINQHTSELTLYNVTNKDDKLLVCCSLVHGDCDILLASTLNVYPLPEKVHNFSCLVENYNSMNCSWNYGKIYGPFKEPEVALQWRMQNDSSWKECSNLNTRYGYCYWDTSHFIMKKIQIRLTLTQPCEVSVVSDFQIDTSKIVKPDPVVDLSSQVLNSTCIQIVWSNTVNIYRKEHRVIVSSKWRDNRELRINSTADTENLSQRRTFCNLHPHTYYTFTVSTQPTGQQAGFFSDPKAIVALTYSDKPSTSPKVTKGGYHWHRMECEGNSNIRRVCIFWKPLKEEDKNGDIKGLHVTFTAVQRNGPTFQEDWPGDLTYGCVNGLLCNTAYTFTIKAENINGTSEQGSTLYISSANSGIPQPTFIVESNNENQLYVSLANVERINADGFVVAWCRNHNGGCKSDHEVQWKRFPWNTREVVIQTDPTKSPQDFLYGVSVLTEQGSSGVEWQDCVYMKNIKPKREPRNVAVSAGQEDNSLVVTWDKLTCKSDEPYIAMYNVRYNKLGDEYRKSQTVTASGEARLVLEDLEEDQIYEVTVRGITKDGGFGPDSEPRTGIPLNKSLKTGTIVGISVTAFLFVVLSGVGCYCVISGCTKKAKYAINEAAKITIPGLNNNDVNTPSEGTSVDCDPSYILAGTLDEIFDNAPDSPGNSNVATAYNGITKEGSTNYSPHDTGPNVTCNGIIEEGRANFLPHGTESNSYCIATACIAITNRGTNSSPHDTGPDSYHFAIACEGITEEGQANSFHHDTGPDGFCTTTACKDITERGTNSSPHETKTDSYHIAVGFEGTAEEGQAKCFHHAGSDGSCIAATCNAVTERGTNTEYVTHILAMTLPVEHSRKQDSPDG